MSRPLTARAAAAAALLLAAVGCSSTHSSAATDTTAATATTAASPATTAVTSPPPSLPPGASRPVGGAPGVGNPTDLSVAPVIGAGTGPAPQSLVIRELLIGTGAVAQQGATVNVQYVGANYADGKVFDSSWQRGGQPVSFSLGGVIPGFAQGIKGMRVGGRRELVIPPALGYGPSGSGPVGANETLVFVVDLVGVQ